MNEVAQLLARNTLLDAYGDLVRPAVGADATALHQLGILQRLGQQGGESAGTHLRHGHAKEAGLGRHRFDRRLVEALAGSGDLPADGLELLGQVHVRHAGLRQFHFGVHAAQEFDVQYILLAARQQQAHAAHDDDERQRDEELALGVPVDLGHADQLQRLDVADQVVFDQQGKDGARNEQGGEQAHHDAPAQREAEALDLLAAHVVDDHADQQGGDVGVDDRAEGLVVAVLDDHTQRGAAGLLLAHALEDQHVGIHGHADGEDHSGDAGQGKACPQHGHGREYQHYVHEQGHVGDGPADQVVSDHQQGHDDHARHAGHERLVPIGFAQAGADGAFADGGVLEPGG